MATTRSKDGTVIAFDRTGEGPAVVLVHPAFGHRAFNPEMGILAELLSPRFTVFNYDRRGRGESGAVDAPPYDVQREVEDLEAVIAEAGGSAFVYGMSSGAALALEAARRGLAVRGLAMYEAPFVVDGGRPPVPTDYLVHLTELVTTGRRGDAVEYFMTRGAGAPPEMVAQMREQPVWPAFEAVAPTLPYDAAVLEGTMYGRPLPAERTTGVTAPTLFIVGSRAGDWAHATAHAVAGALPDARVHEVEGEFHAAGPPDLAAAVGDFFAA